MKKLVIAGAVALAGCSGDYTEVVDGEAPETIVQPDPVDPEMQALYDEVGTVPDYKGEDYRIRYDEAPGGEPEHPQHPQDPSEKAQIAVLQGWSVEGVLAFQDGQPQTVNGITYADFCTNTQFGVCDNSWHAQAKYTNFGATGQEGPAYVTGMCGVGSGRHWSPCVLPYITHARGGRTITWRLNRSTCPNALLPRLDVAIPQAHSNMALNTGLTFTNVTGPANVEYKCENGIGTNGAASALWSPSGAMTPRWGAFVDVTETCTESGYGSSSYIQKSDLYYTHSSSMIRFNPDELSRVAGACGLDAFYFERMIKNVTIHEFGHLFGFTHQIYTNLDYAIMAKELTCAEVKMSMGWHPFNRQSIKDLDARLGSNLTVIGQQNACLNPQLQ